MEVERDKKVSMISVSYRGKNFTVEVPSDATVGVLGKQLSQATGVAISTMRLLVPKGKRLPAAAVMPATEPHSSSTLEASGITPGVVIRMMGASAEEVKEVSQPVKEERVLGFKEEERRQTARRTYKPQIRLPDGPYTFQHYKSLELPSVKGIRNEYMLRNHKPRIRLPDGPYTFHYFQIIKELPFVKLSPPPEKALALMHRLASDPGIVAIMRKYKWQVGMMTELAPQGYVGVSPKCLLGFNKNRGEEISLRLRTDDLKGFRKYESIKMTLLHELAHMVHDEHDENFHALDKLLNREVVELDWTHGHGHTLSGFSRPVDDDDEPVTGGGVRSGHKLGGNSIGADARAAAVLAAMDRYRRSNIAPFSARINDASISSISDDPDEEDDYDSDEILVLSDDSEPPSDDQTERTEPDPDDARASLEEPDPDDSTQAFREPDPDDHSTLTEEQEPDPDDESKNAEEPDPDDESKNAEEPDPDDESMNAEEPYKCIPLSDEEDAIVSMQKEVAKAYGRLQLAVMSIRNQAATTADQDQSLDTLSKIVNNLISHPNDDKYKHLPKGKAAFQERLNRFQGALEFLREVGFKDEGSEYVVRRLDSGLLFLARSVLEDL